MRLQLLRQLVPELLVVREGLLREGLHVQLPQLPAHRNADADLEPRLQTGVGAGRQHGDRGDVVQDACLRSY